MGMDLQINLINQLEGALTSKDYCLAPELLGTRNWTKTEYTMISWRYVKVGPKIGPTWSRRPGPPPRPMKRDA
jgi:hypothetical protein